MTKDKTQNDDNGSKLKRKEYEKELRKLQAELCHLQAWVKHKDLRIIVLFEGRDGAGKGGTIRAITERVSPRVFRVVALPAPTDREKTQMYIQRYMAHFPAAGEIVIFDRSWYNRAGVELVMGFCTKIWASWIIHDRRQGRQLGRQRDSENAFLRRGAAPRPQAPPRPPAGDRRPEGRRVRPDGAASGTRCSSGR